MNIIQQNCENITNFCSIYKHIIPHKDMSYDIISEILIQKNFRHKTDELFNLLNIQINTKKFNVIFMIVYHPDFTLNEERNIYDENLFNISKIVLDNFNDLLNDFTIEKQQCFEKNLNNYLNDFDKWKQNSLEKKLKPIVEQYYSLIDMQNLILEESDSDGRQLWISEIEKIKQKWEKQIKQSGGDYLLQNYTKPEIILDDKIIMEISKNIYSAFWNDFKEDLMKEPPNYLRLIDFLKDFKTLVRDCIQTTSAEAFSDSSGSIEFLNNIDQHLDIDLIKQQIEYNAINIVDIYSILNYIVSIIKQLQAPEDDVDTENWWNDLTQKFENNLPLYEIFPNFFFIAFSKLEKIKLIKNTIFSTNVN